MSYAFALCENHYLTEPDDDDLDDLIVRVEEDCRADHCGACDSPYNEGTDGDDLVCSGCGARVNLVERARARLEDRSEPDAG